MVKSRLKINTILNIFVFLAIGIVAFYDALTGDVLPWNGSGHILHTAVSFLFACLFIYLACISEKIIINGNEVVFCSVLYLWKKRLTIYDVDYYKIGECGENCDECVRFYKNGKRLHWGINSKFYSNYDELVHALPWPCGDSDNQ